MAQPEKPVPTQYEPYSEDNDTVNTDGTTSYEKPITYFVYMLK